MKIKLLFSGIVVLFACSSSFYDVDKTNESILGVWVYSHAKNSIMEYVRADSFDNSKPGLEFYRSGKMTKRQNGGWCSTPPITYANYEGTWEFTSDSILTLSSDYWGGKQKQEWKIFELSTDSLRIEVLNYRVTETKQ